MNREFIFADVIARAKECFECATDKDLAARLGISPQTLGNRKKTESIPYAEILAVAMEIGADVTYILTGTRSVAVEAAPDRPGVYIADPRKLALLDNYEHSTKEGQRAIERVALLESETQYKDVTAKKKQAG